MDCLLGHALHPFKPLMRQLTVKPPDLMAEQTGCALGQAASSTLEHCASVT